MKRLVAAALLLATSLSATTAKAEERPNSLRDGAKAFQFMFESGLSGGGVLFKNHFGARNALRLGFSGRFSMADEELEALGIGTGDYENDYASLGSDLMYLRYVGPMKSAAFYFGTGLFFELSEQSRVRSEYEFGVGTYYESSEDEATTVGILGALGAEWFITETLSLAVEYAISAGYRWYERQEYYERTGDPPHGNNWSGHSWEVDASRYGRIGLGLYF